MRQSQQRGSHPNYKARRESEFETERENYHEDYNDDYNSIEDETYARGGYGRSSGRGGVGRNYMLNEQAHGREEIYGRQDERQNERQDERQRYADDRGDNSPQRDSEGRYDRSHSQDEDFERQSSRRNRWARESRNPRH